MHLIKRSSKVLALAAVAAGMMAPAAQADDVTISCALTGVTGSINPGVTAILNGTGGTGAFSFSGSAQCAGTTEDDGAIQTAATINASGTFANTICGTGTADGNASINFADPRAGDATAAFHIDFTGGVGQLTISTFSSTEPSNGSGSGVINIVPTGGNCVNQNVTQFTVGGAFQAQGT